MRTTTITLALGLLGPAIGWAQTRPDAGVPVARLESGRGSQIGSFEAPRSGSSSLCLEMVDGPGAVRTLGFGGSRFEIRGRPEPILSENLQWVGAHEGVPIFVGRLAPKPITDLWLPVCQPAGHYQLYTRAGVGPAPEGR